MSILTRRRALSLLAVAGAPARAATEGAAEYLTLRHRDLEVAIAPQRGAEIASIRFGPRELLYRAKDYSPTSGWTGRAPWLWPAVGRNFAPGHRPDGGNAVTGSYDHGGQRYPMPIHGFARDLPWRVAQRSARHAVLTLADSPTTRRYYPFGFALSLEYQLELSGSLAILFRVTASPLNREPMFFSAGNHISFAVPPATTFTTKSARVLFKTAQGLPSGESAARDYLRPTPLTEIVKEYPLSLSGYGRNARLRFEDPAGLAVTLDHEADLIPPEPAIRFNLWGTPACFCPEPWVGLQNSFNLRQGLVFLDPGRAWNWRLRLSYSNRNATTGSTRAARRAGP